MNDLKIFIVDDDVFFLHMMEQHLRNLGYSLITTFTNGSDCLDALPLNPDLVFLDHNMDHLSGYDVLRKIKRYDPNLFVVMVSAQVEIKTAVDVLKHGAFDYLEKDDNTLGKVEAIINRMIDVKAHLRRTQPSVFHKVLQSLLLCGL